ncbi:MAG: amidohydrolase, partial [Microbacteriaceae bacterium]
MSAGCCTASPLAHAHLGASVASAGSTIAPANHAAAVKVTEKADLLVEGTIVSGKFGAPAAEAMAVSGGKIIAIGTRAELEGLIDASTTILKPDGVVIPGL